MMNTNSVKSRDDLVQFLNQFNEELRNGGRDWTNKSLQDFLEAMASWVEDMDGYYENMGLTQQVDLTKEVVHWRVFADMLMAARIYE